ncbi:MAG TPA: hypothetical protein PKW40_04870 [Bacillota bacterium]|nr:hypothetical protein [Bacillota bacterium]
MDYIHIGIYSKEDGYGELLSKKLAQYYPRFYFTILSEEQIRHSGLRNQYDLLMVDGLREPLSGKYVGLVSSPSQVVIDEERLEFKLFKYGNVREMTHHLLFLYSTITGRPRYSLQKHSAQYIMFLSPGGGMGTTTIALGTAHCLARHLGKKVLYLSLEDFVSASISSTERGLEEFIYYYQNHPARATPLEAYQEKGLFEIWKFRPRWGPNPLLALEELELLSLLDFIEKNGGYDYIIFDIGNRSCFWSESFLARSHRIVMVTHKGLNKGEMKRWNDYLKIIGGDLFDNKIQWVVNRCGVIAEWKNDEDIRLLGIDESEESLSTTLDGLSMKGDFGGDMKRLMKELT